MTSTLTSPTGDTIQERATAPVEILGMIGTRDASESRPGLRPAVDPDYTRRFARAHEEAGFDRILIGYGSSWPEGTQVAAHVAAHTERLGLLVAHRPGFVAPTLAARTFATLDQFSGGRVAVHIITGGNDAEQRRDGDYLDQDERYARTDEYLTILRRAWDSAEPFAFEGRYYRFEDYAPGVLPYGDRHLPLFFGGSSAAAYRVGGKHADTFMLWGEPLAETAEQIASVRAAADGRRPRRRRGSASRSGRSSRPTEELAWERAHGILDTHQERAGPGLPAGAQARPAASPQNVGSQRLLAAAAKGDLHDRALWTPTATAAGAGGNSTALVGSPETVAAAILDYVDIGVDTVLIRGYDPLDDAIDYGRHVLPLVRQELGAPWPLTGPSSPGTRSTGRPGRRAGARRRRAVRGHAARRPRRRRGQGRAADRRPDAVVAADRRGRGDRRAVQPQLRLGQPQQAQRGRRPQGPGRPGPGPRALVDAADVVVENYRPGVLDRLGLGYDEVIRDRDRGLVYCSVSGYGLTSPYVNDGAYDVVIQGMSGLMSVTGDRHGGPVKAGVPVGDFTAGLYAALTVAALLPVGAARAARCASTARCSTACSRPRRCRPASTGGPAWSPRRLGTAHPRNAPYQAFRARDGDFTVAAGNDRLWAAVAEVAGLPELGRRPAVRARRRRGWRTSSCWPGSCRRGSAADGPRTGCASCAPAASRAARSTPSARSSPTSTSRATGLVQEQKVPVAGLTPDRRLPGPHLRRPEPARPRRAGARRGHRRGPGRVGRRVT